MAVPLVRDGRLLESQIELGSADWSKWLTENKSFRVESETGSFTANKNKSGFWYAFRKKKGKLYNRYLGAGEDITWTQCKMVAKELNNEILSGVKRSPQEIRIAQLEEKIAVLEKENAQLREQLKSAA